MLLFWRVYAVVYLVLVVAGLPPALSRFPHLSPIELIDMAFFTPVAVVGLWSAAYRHLSLPKHTWKVLLFASVFWRALAVGNAVLFENVVPKFQASLGAISGKMTAGAANAFVFAALTMAFLAATLLTLPPLIALYRNAYGNESLLQLMSPSRMRSRQAVT